MIFMGVLFYIAGIAFFYFLFEREVGFMFWQEYSFGIVASIFWPVTLIIGALLYYKGQLKGNLK